jgi:hypothetical protein
MSERQPIRVLNPGNQDMWQELRRRSEIRNNFLVPLYVMWPKNLPDDTARAGLQGVMDAVRVSGQDRQVISFGSRVFSEGDYSSAQWYVDEVYRRQPLRRDVGYGSQLDTGYFGGLFANEPWQQETPHWEVLMVNDDLNSMVDGRYINYVFGSTDPGFPYSVQSAKRMLEETPNRDLANAMYRNLLRHEVGHVFGLVNRSDAVQQLGGHCPNECSMRQTMDLSALRDNTLRIEISGRMFCGDCTVEVNSYKSRYRSLPG